MLNQVKIGKFIAQMRKEKGLTQRQLAEQVGVSDKTVSKWETGRSMPDNSVIMDVCLILGISVNELLVGEQIPEESYMDKAEENMIELVKESELHKKKGKWSILGTVAGLVMLGGACLGTILCAGGVQAVGWFMDMPSLLLTISIPLLVQAVSGTLSDFFLGFSIICGKKECGKEQTLDAWNAMKTMLYSLPLAGGFACVVGVVTILGMLDNPERLGQNLAVALLSVFYCSLLEIFLLPIAVRLRKKVCSL